MLDAAGTGGFGRQRITLGRFFLVSCMVFAVVASMGQQPMRGQVPLVAGDSNGTPVLSNVAEVRRLTADVAGQKLPVHIVGVVTALAGLKKAFFLQDATAGISVDRIDQFDVNVGDRVDVSGFTHPGLFAPSLFSTTVKVLGHVPLPHALPVSYTELLGGKQDSKRIELTGVVHTARLGKLFDNDVLFVGLDIGGTTVKLMLQDYAGYDSAHLIDARVRVRGTCSTEFNDKRQFVGSGLFIPSRNDLEVIEPAKEDPFAEPASPMRQALQFGQAQHRVKVVGTVTWQDPGRGFYLQDGQDGIHIQTETRETVEVGTRVEAVGFPATGEYSPVLRWAAIRQIGPAEPVKPLLVKAADVIYLDSYFNQTKYDSQLIQIQGKVIESHFKSGGHRIIILSDQNQLFEAYLSHSDPKSNVVAGTAVLLTGICTIRADEDRKPVAFEVLLRSSDDIDILQRAPWWTPGHAIWVLGILAAAMAMVVLWVVVLKNRVERQTRTIKESEERFRTLAERDALTGLPNRLMLEEHIDESLARCKESRCHAAVFTIDIDRFKQINDTYGHPVGDECLKAVASRLRSAATQAEIIARTGGEEFTLVVGGLDSPEDAERIGNKLLDLFRDPMVLGEVELAVTVSVGCALYPDDGLETKELRKRSDQALYEAKRTGRNKVVFATRELAAQLERTVNIEDALRESLRAGSFALAYQPVYDAAGNIRSMEALLRTGDEFLSSLGPAVYVRVAESSGLIQPIGRWVLQAVCRHIVAWRAAGYEVCPISINLTASQLLQNGFSVDVLEILSSFDLHPSVIEFELTETTAIGDFHTVSERVARLALAGVAFVIDDFGTGHSSLARLHQLPVSAIKIDRGFIQGLERGGGTQKVVQTAIAMAKSLSFRAVAKGIEQPEQLELLRELGCDLFQGYLLAKPMPAKGITPLLKQKEEQVLAGVS